MVIDLSQVVGTLRYGAYYGKHRKKYIIFLTAFIIVGFLSMAGAIVGFSIKLAENLLPVVDFVLILVGCGFFFFGVPLLFLFIFLKNEKIKKQILKWSDDAIEVYAHSKCVGEQDDPRPFVFGVQYAKIQVTFELDGKHYTKMSGKTGRLGTDDGFSRLWLKYRDRAIRIMYSRKYDQVIVLNDIENNKN